ncbi:single-stranded-DNA-specific exonuclease RecJ [Pelosinus sp. UFO1]|uniref:single-stranded-DNA-specific exonuclease RecJ n=1 Tax=Pelosinus sp. UFO1 TaxID=484770 RepID=UPI0004D1DD8F|nr:single-stranded-DNA-specific exonuclease RecJ [Pelosinus sp. UFO1]AIF51457.1 single-stranded-DNA-specific exonuclease RecJ [Pelosinus sp. UFO1]
MPKIRKSWRVMPENIPLKKELSNSLGISDIIAQVLVNRGIMDKSIAEEFLFGGQEKLSDPYLLKDMEKAVSRIVYAITNHQKMVVYGDYDVDGMTSSALIYKVFTKLGGTIEYYIPERQNEGYGLNSVALETLIARGTELLITVDCGISAIEEVKAVANRLDIIITDHHEPAQCLPVAHAIINPKQRECSYPEKNLAGVGVAFKLCQALWQYYYENDEKLLEYLDIVAVGTVADIVSITGENRILVKLGLTEIAKTKNIGLKELMEVCRIDANKIDTGKIGFAIAPRLNAAGRISRADYGVELLITEDVERAKELALYLEGENSQRQVVEKNIQAAAEEFIAQIDLNVTKVLVVVGEDWHSGVIGIVASRLVERYYRPVIMVSIRDGIGKASCRSIPAFDIYDALSQCSDLLLQFGGHHQAAGLSILPKHIEELGARLNQIANTTLSQADYIPVLTIDSLVSLNEINANFLEQLSCLEPYGMGNQSPIFACKSVEIKDIRTIGQEARHLKLKVSQENITNDVVAWQMGGLAENLQDTEKVELAFFPEFNEWQGKRKIQLRAYDVKQIELTDVERLYVLHKNDAKQRIYSPECFLYADKVISAANEKQLDDWVLKDVRHIADKFSYLLDVVKQQEKTLIFVNTPYEAFSLAEKLRACLPSYKDQVGFYHAGLNEEWKNKVQAWFRDDILKVIFTTTLFVNEGLKFDHVGHMMLYSLPFTMQGFLQQCWSGMNSMQSTYIHLLFNNEDIANNHLLLLQANPERIVVGQIYLVLKQSGSEVTDSQVIDQVWSKYQVTISEASVRTAIKILEELKLIQCVISEVRREILILPTPKDKLDIEQSTTFRQGMNQKDEFMKFAEKLMKLSSNELLLAIKGNNV